MTDRQNDTAEDRRDELRGYTAAVVPVHIEIHSTPVVVDLTAAEAILRAAKSIFLGDCDCRKTEQECAHSVRSCLALNRDASGDDVWDPSFHEVSLDEALAVLQATHEAGLVHLAYRNKDGEINEFCSCCGCCCWFLKALKQYGDDHEGVIESSRIASQLQERCNGCGVCATTCPFGAWEISQDGSTPSLVRSRCFGCGLCVTACPAGAIAFVDRMGKDPSPTG